MDPKAKNFFDTGKVMQLGTTRDGYSSVTSVFYVPSEDYRSVYWMSEPRRRHSQDIEKDSRVSGTIVIREDWPTASLQFRGTAGAVEDLDEIEKATDTYTAKYPNTAEGFVERYKEGRNKHLFYKLTMTTLELLDNDNFSDGPVAIELD
jgi:uncharacterized protein YhbP (UPF0306 family)